ncbi:hypothetical protein AB3R30_26430 [Leptolyngbyaceae cyanobacterium UHCC 1019]
MKLPFRYRRRHQPTIIKAFLGMALVGCAIASIPDTQRNLERLSQIRDRAAAISQEQELQRLDAEKIAELAKVADARYAAGCNTFVVSLANTSKFANITPGGKVINPTTGANLAPGLVVCDDKGTTGIMADVGSGETGIVDVATTQNFTLVKQAMQLHGINPQSGDGRIGGANAQIKH